MRIISGRHRGHMATLHQFADDQVTADCANCRTRDIVLRPSQVRLSDAEVTRMSESYENFVRGGSREGLFWKHWRLADGGILARREDGQ